MTSFNDYLSEKTNMVLDGGFYAEFTFNTQNHRAGQFWNNFLGSEPKQNSSKS